MKYYTGAENYGKGFITHEDNERSQIEGYPGDVWLSENNDVWAARVGAAEVTKEQAQAIVDTAIQGVLDPETGEQIVIILP
jgi:hypothetical protein